MTSPPPDAANPFPVTRSNGLTVTWSGGQANGFIQFEAISATDNTFNNGADFLCLLPSAAGTFTVPPSVLLALPAGNFGQMVMRRLTDPVSLSGLSVSKSIAWYSSGTPLAFL